MKLLENFDNHNKVLTLTVKGLSVAVLSLTFIGGVSVYNNYTHQGPSCSSNKGSFSFWLKKNKSNPEGAIVSIFEKRIQLENGTTSCHGLFKTKQGQYLDWQGEVSELTYGENVGWAKIVNRL